MSFSEGYVLIGLGKTYIDECKLLIDTLRKQNDNRPVSIVVNEEDRTYAKSIGIFDKIINFQIFDQDIWNMCNTISEKFIIYPRMFLENYIQYDHNIIIDSDIICQAHTDKVWKYCKERNQSITQLGFINDPEWHWGSINEVSEAFGKHVPHTHGGFFYIRREDEIINKFFKFVRETFYKYDEYKCKRKYKNGMVDEILFAIAHAQFDMYPVEFHEFPIMTFNSKPDIVPNAIKGKETLGLIPFVHMYDYKPKSENYMKVYNKIMNLYFTPLR